MRNVAFSPIAFQEYNEWFDINIQLISRIKVLIRDIERDPFRGIGKPEPFKGNWAGYWSRPKDGKHQLIYKVSDSQILIVKCKGHY